MIYTFSGTGNSEYVARRVAKITGDEITSLNQQLKQGLCSAAAEEVQVFCVPTYAWRIPRIVEDWIRRAGFTPGARAWFVMTCGGQIGDAATFNKRLCEAKGLTYMGTAQILMPENYIAMFNAPDSAEAKEIVARANPGIDQAAQYIKEGKSFPAPGRTIIDRAMSAINPIFYATIVNDKAFTSGDACTSCGICARACPMNNIKLENGRPKWNGNCTHCMACITLCPTKAIEYGRSSAGKPRYRCPRE